MTEENDRSDLHAVGDRIEALLEELQSSTEGRVWMRVEELTRLLTELYGAGLSRALELIGDDRETIGRFAADELLGSLLILHDLHPDDLATRAARAVDAVAPTVRKAGSEVQLSRVDADAGTVTVLVTSAGSGCGSTGDTLRETVATALAGAVPDAMLVDVRVETVTAPTPVRLGSKPVSVGTRL